MPVFYLDTNSLATAARVYNDATLLSVAADGYYSTVDGYNYRQQSSGSLIGEGLISCTYIETLEASLLGPTAVTFNGNLINDGGGVDSIGFVYSTTANPIYNGPNVLFVNYSGALDEGDYSVAVTGLEPSTPYYFKAVAINDNTVYYGDQQIATTTTTPGFEVNLCYSSESSELACSCGDPGGDGGVVVKNMNSEANNTINSIKVNGTDIIVDSGSFPIPPNNNRNGQYSNGTELSEVKVNVSSTFSNRVELKYINPFNVLVTICLTAPSGDVTFTNVDLSENPVIRVTFAGGDCQ